MRLLIISCLMLLLPLATVCAAGSPPAATPVAADTAAATAKPEITPPPAPMPRMLPPAGEPQIATAPIMMPPGRPSTHLTPVATPAANSVEIVVPPLLLMEDEIATPAEETGATATSAPARTAAPAPAAVPPSSPKPTTAPAPAPAAAARPIPAPAPISAPPPSPATAVRPAPAPQREHALPTTYDELYRLGREHMAAGNYPDAAIALAAANLLKFDNFAAHYALACVHTALGDDASARHELELARLFMQ